jgi:hypothetical protein
MKNGDKGPRRFSSGHVRDAWRFGVRRGYTFLGVVLVLFGGGFSVASYSLLHSVPLTALGIACAILGFTAASLPEEMKATDSVIAILRGSTFATGAVLDDVENSGVKLSQLRKGGILLAPEALTSAIDISASPRYLPPRDGLIGVFIPVRPIAKSTGPEAMWQAPRKLDGNSQDGLLVFPIGAAIPAIPGLATKGGSIVDSLQEVLVASGICSHIDVAEAGNILILEARDVKVGGENTHYADVLGSIPVSLAASVVAAISEKQVIILDEQNEGGRRVSRLLEI